MKNAKLAFIKSKRMLKPGLFSFIKNKLVALTAASKKLLAAIINRLCAMESNPAKKNTIIPMIIDRRNLDSRLNIFIINN